MRCLTDIEQYRLKLLTTYSISVALIEPTATGLKKSIMDATGSVRSYLKDNKIHDYEIQKQGQESKVVLAGLIYEQLSAKKTNVSLYRPNTKKGDPRIWLSGLNKYACANDILVLIVFQGMVHVFNLTSFPLAEMLKSIIANPLQDLIFEINRTENIISNELLFKLRQIAKRGLIRSEVAADTSVGRTLETALGIDINSSKQPDYKGIELKAFRSQRGTRKTLFAQVPNWKLSKFKSSSEILNKFGYQSGDDFKLYCTVSSLSRNTQGLTLCLDAELKQLIENSDKPKVGDFVLWTFDKLHERLQSKHRETFWVKADSSVKQDGIEYFQYKEVIHTQKPINTQFNILLEQGIITLDHLIKRNSKGRVIEKGPIFKIRSSGLDLLFPPNKKYSLLD